MIEQIKNFFKKKDNLLILLLIGVLLFVISIPTKKSDTVNREKSDIRSVSYSNTEASSDNLYACADWLTMEYQYRDMLSKELEAMLSKMEGLGQVKVMITLKNTNTNVYSDVDATAGLWQQNKPQIITTEYPKVEGVVVLAQTYVEASMNKEITEAICALFDLEPHKVKVLKAKQG